jgi:hypothetical protein
MAEFIGVLRIAREFEPADDGYHISPCIAPISVIHDDMILWCNVV